MDVESSSKRKLDNGSPDKESSNKKPHNDTEFSMSEIIADSTHLLDDSEKVNKILEEQSSSKDSFDDNTDRSLLDTIVQAFNDEEKVTIKPEELILSLKTKLNKKDEEIEMLKIKNIRLENEIKVMQKEAEADKSKRDRYKIAIIKLNKIANVVKPTPKVTESERVRENVSKESENTRKEMETPTQKKNIKCRYEDRGLCNAKENCEFIHPKYICRQFSYQGRCNRRSRCQYRHPTSHCFEWERKGNCSRGDRCKFRHPSEMRQQLSFLGQQKPTISPPNQAPRVEIPPKGTHPTSWNGTTNTRGLTISNQPPILANHLIQNNRSNTQNFPPMMFPPLIQEIQPRNQPQPPSQYPQQSHHRPTQSPNLLQLGQFQGRSM